MNSNMNARHGAARVIIAQNRSFATRIAKATAIVSIQPAAVTVTAPRTSSAKVTKVLVIHATLIQNASRVYVNNISVLLRHKTIGRNKYLIML